MWCWHFVFVCMYICMYVYPSHSTRDTLIAQLLAAIALFPAVCRRHTRQVGSTLHHHWPRICSLCRLITVHCVQLSLLFNHADASTTCHQLSLLFNHVLNGCWRVYHHCVPLCLLLNRMLNSCWRFRHFGCGHHALSLTHSTVSFIWIETSWI